VFALINSTFWSLGPFAGAVAIAVAGNAGLFDPEDGTTATSSGFPQLSNRLYFEALEPFLAANTRTALSRANSQQEWNTFLLSSPDFNYE